MSKEYILSLITEHNISHKNEKTIKPIKIKLYFSLSDSDRITTDITKATKFNSKTEAENLLQMVDYAGFKVEEVPPVMS